MLIALKQSVAPSDQARELELTNRYQKLKKAPKGQNIDDWLKQWEKTYASCKKLDLPDVARTRLLYDFLKAVQELAPDFAGIWMVRIQEREHNGEVIPDIYTILEHSRNHARVQNAQKAQVEHGAFASTFRNQKLEDKNKEVKPCLCGKLHRFKAC
jgi:cell division protein YceG involved in septum cleavage